MATATTKKYKWLKITGIVIGSLIAIILLAVAWLQTASGKNFVRQKVVAFVEKKTGGKLQIGQLDYSLPNWISLSNVVAFDQHNDTLFSGGLLRVDIDMFALIKGNINIHEVRLSKITGFVNRRQGDSTFNYQYLIDAFASKSKDTVAEKKSTNIQLDHLLLDTVAIRFFDSLNNIFCTAYIGHFNCAPSKLDIDHMDYAIDRFTLNNTTVNLTDKSTKNEKAKEAAVDATTASSPLKVALRNLDVHALNVMYNNVSSKLNYNNQIDSLQIRDASINLLQQYFTAKQIMLNNSSIAMLTNNAATNVKDTVSKVVDIATKQGWRVKVDALRLANNKVMLVNNGIPAVKEGMDYNHLTLNNILVQTDDIYYSGDTIKANLLATSLSANGFLLQQLKGNVYKDANTAWAKGLIAKTQQSLLAADGDIVFNTNSKNEMLNDATKLNFNIQKSYAGYNEILFFIPSFKRKAPIDLKPTQKLLLNAKANGTLRDINIVYAALQTDDGRIQLNAKGRTQNVMDTKNLRYQLVLDKLYFDKSILSSSMRKQLQKQQLNLPPNITVNGTANGGMSDVQSNLKVQSAFGYAAISATANNFTNTKHMRYDVALTGNKLQTGKWINKDSLMGLFTGTIHVKGNGTNYKSDAISAAAAIKSFVVKGYTYTGVKLNAALKGGAFTAKGGVIDDNVAANLQLNGTVTGQYPTVKGTIVVDRADLRKLNLTKDSTTILTTIIIDAENLDPKNLNASILLDSTIIAMNGKRLYADSISVQAIAGNDSTKVFVKAPFANASMIGQYDYQHLPAAMNAFIRHNYLKQNTDSIKVIDQQMVFNATIMQDAIVQQMLPELIMEKPAVIQAFFDNRRQDTVLHLTANVPSVTYGTNTIENLAIDANGLDTSLRFALTTNSITAGSKKFYSTAINGNMSGNILKATVTSNDAKQKEFYAVSAIMEMTKEGNVFHLADSLRLNYDQWAVAPDNNISITKEGYIINNFSISKNGQSILIKNQQPNIVSPIDVKIDNFNIGDVLTIANQDSTLAGGILNINAVIQQPIKGLPEVQGTASIQKLTYQKTVIGDVALNTTVAPDRSIKVTGGITGANMVMLDGGYNTNNSTFSISTDIQRLDLKAVEAFSQGTITRTAGNLHGNVYAFGSVSDPKWRGELTFDSTQLATSMFGSLYKINGQKIDFEYPNIGLYDFTITDSLQQKLVVDGSINMNKNKEMGLDINVNADNFLAVNQPRTSTALVYGEGYVDAAVHVGGTAGAPDISGSASLNDKSDIHYVLPAKNSYKDDLKQVVKFIDIDTIKSFKNSNVLFTTASDTAAVSSFKGLKYNLNLEINENANVAVLIDPSTGDELTLKGSAQLNAGVDENGAMGITGVYQLKQGAYSLSYQFIKRRFELVDGSTITFAGNPMNGVADITAQYEIETSPKELLGNEVSENSASLGAAYNTKIPFEVLLKIKGPLTKPSLSFDIKVKENAEGVNTNLATTIDNKLTQYRNSESDMNKQVFALLILGRFIGDRSSDFFAGNGGNSSANDVVKQSVSKFLAEAVNQIASDLIKGVDINLDLKNYEGDATTNAAKRTDLNVELSKQLLNDRLTVTVGKSFTVEGDDPLAKTQNNSNLQFLPDISTTYRLSKDGKYALRAYRRNQYEAILDGYFTETGVAFSLTMNYEKFKEIFKKQKDEAKVTMKSSRSNKNGQN